MMASDQQEAPANEESAATATVLQVRARRPSTLLVDTGFTVVSAYVEQFWQSALGPTSTALIRHLARHRLAIGDHTASYVPIDLAATRAALGVGRKGQAGKSGPLFRSIERLARFEFLTVDDSSSNVPSHITIATRVQTVPSGIRRHWPDELTLRRNAFIEQVLGEEGDGLE